jgi:FAD dependent oxidoreductase
LRKQPPEWSAEPERKKEFFMETVKLTREIPVLDSYDVLVAGGGPAGSAAAVCAARLGARVLLVEASGCLGGMCTGGLVANFAPMSDGERPLVGGFTRELIETLYARDVLGPDVTPKYWMSDYNRKIQFKPEGLKRVLDEYCLNAGVDVLFFTRLIDAEAEGHRVKGAIVANVEGLTYVRAKVFIDATGDGVLADAAGAPCLVAGQAWPYAPATLCSLHGGMNWNDPAYEGGTKGLDRMFKRVREELIPRANADGHFSNPDPHMMGMKSIGHTVAALNAGQLFKLNALNAFELSQGMIAGRKLAVEYTEFYRKYVPGCENLQLLTTAPLLGVRDTRRIIGEFELTMEDYTARRQFPDQIAVYNRPPNVHPTNTSKAEFDRHYKEMETNEIKLGRGECVGIPYSILVPKDWENLWVAGRCHSSDTGVHGSIRGQSAAFMMGEAAATAAKQSLDSGQPACDLDTEQLVETLRARGGYLPQPELSKVMTRSGARSEERKMSELVREDA